jgi:hypothetical protein
MFVLILFSSPAHAWGPTGHRIVAEIAQRHLDPAVAVKIEKILGGRNLADVANWPDELREDRSYDKYKRLHFATVPDGTAHYSDSKKDPCGDVVVAIHTLVDFLGTGEGARLSAVKAFTETIDSADPKVACNPVATRPLDQAMAIALLVHFVGDIHQPLHVGGTDAGGNFVRVSWMTTQSSNLHSVWDSELIAASGLSYTEFTRYLDRGGAEESDNWSRATVEAWADEAIALRPGIYRFPDLQKQGVGEPSPADLRTLLMWDYVVPVSYAYIGAHRDDLHKQLLKGGLRLARVLNAIALRYP